MVALGAPILSYALSIQWISFPDGHRTEFDQAIEMMFPIFAVLSVVIGLFDLYLGWKGRLEENRRAFRITSISLVGPFALALLTEYLLLLFLDHGQGG